MSLLTCKGLLFSYLKIPDTLVTTGSSDPDLATQAQILAAINGKYQSIATDNKCIEKEVTITVSTTSKEYSSAIPTDYIETIALTSSVSPKALKATFRADSDLISGSGFSYYSLYGENIIIFDATQACGDTSIRHTYWAIPASLSADIDEFKYPLRNWERLIALGTAVDLLAKDMSQSALERLPFIQTLYQDELSRFQNMWSSKLARNAGILDQTHMVGGYSQID